MFTFKAIIVVEVTNVWNYPEEVTSRWQKQRPRNRRAVSKHRWTPTSHTPNKETDIYTLKPADTILATSKIW